MEIHLALLYFSAISFIVYGINSFFSRRMISEYQRWGFGNQRIILCCCQLLGGLGLLVGLSIPILLTVASFLLMCMMPVAVFVRLRIRDRFLKMVPALLYVILTLIIFCNSIT